MAAIAQNYDWLSSMLHVACPAPKIVERVLNKNFTLEVAVQCDIAVPRTVSIANSTDFDAAAARLQFPVVVKPGIRSAGRPASFKARYFRDLASLEIWLSNNSGMDLLLQEYCPGEGVGVEMLIHNGRCLATFQHRRLKEDPPGGGVAVMAVSEAPDPALAAASQRLLVALDWQGPAMVEFRRNPADGKAVLMEVNGRYWGTTALPLMAGIEFPVYEWQLLHGQQPAIPSSYATGIKWRWTAGYLSRLHAVIAGSSEELVRRSRFRELVQAPSDLSPFHRDALWSLADPQPAIRESVDTVLQLLKADARAVVKRVVPQGLKKDLLTAQRLGKKAGPIYLKLRLMDSLGIRQANMQRVPKTARSFVFVCFGNLMRSAMAEQIMIRIAKERLPGEDIRIASAGMHANPGREAHSWVQAVCTRVGLPISQHRSKLFTPEMANQADAIFAMDFQNKAELLAQYPAARHKIFMLSAYADGPQRYREIADPYFGSEEVTYDCYQLLRGCIENLVADIFPVAAQPVSPEKDRVLH